MKNLYKPESIRPWRHQTILENPGTDVGRQCAMLFHFVILLIWKICTKYLNNLKQQIKCLLYSICIKYLTEFDYIVYSIQSTDGKMTYKYTVMNKNIGIAKSLS